MGCAKQVLMPSGSFVDGHWLLVVSLPMFVYPLVKCRKLTSLAVRFAAEPRNCVTYVEYSHFDAEAIE